MFRIHKHWQDTEDRGRGVDVGGYDNNLTSLFPGQS